MTTTNGQLARIAAGIDGSRPALAALTWATTLADEAGASVTALMAWNYPTSLLLPIVGAPVLPAEAMEATTQAALGAAIGDHPGRGSITELSTPMGSARSVLVEASKDHDLVIVGRTGRGPLERLVLGSTASYVARHAECPVLLVADDSIPDRLTVAVDGSAQSVAALEWALGVRHSRQVVAIYSHDESVLDELPLSSEERAPFDARARELLDEAIATAAGRAGVDASEVTAEVRTGDPRTSIVDAIEPDDLLVMGARGHSGLAAWVLGSLADYAVHHSSAPLVIWNEP